MHKFARDAYSAGIHYIGGCCGFEPYHIRAVAEEVNFQSLSKLWRCKKPLVQVFLQAVLRTFHKRLSRLCVLCVELVVVVGGGEGVLLSVFHPSCWLFSHLKKTFYNQPLEVFLLVIRYVLVLILRTSIIMSLDINKNEGVAEMTLGQLKQLCFWRVLDLASETLHFSQVSQ